MSIIEAPCLTPIALTGVVRKIRRPAGFLSTILYGSEETLSTETMELGRDNEQRETYDFVRPGASALVVGQQDRSMEHIVTPNIRVKTSMNPGDITGVRDLGEDPFNQSRSAFNGKMQRETARIQNQQMRGVMNTKELMCSQALQGELSYSQVGADAYILNYGRPADNEVELGANAQWDELTAWIEGDFREAKRLVAAEEDGLPVTDCILGAEAAEEFLQNEAVRVRLDTTNMNTGSLDLTNPFTEDGTVNFLGNFMGIKVWTYTQTLPQYGNPVELVRSKYAEFVSRNSSAGTKTYYGAVLDDFDFLRGSGKGYGSVVNRSGAVGGVGKYFAKSWQTPDPTSIWLLLQSRPLPFNRRPGWNVSMKVLPG